MNQPYINLEQGSDEWKQARLGHVTASNMAEVMSKGKGTAEAVGRYKYKVRLVAERLTMTAGESYTNAAMQWGIEQEPAAKEAFTAKTGLAITDLGFVDHPFIDLCGASPDGLIESTHELVEVKCPSTATMLSWLMEAAQDKTWVPEEYKPQMALQSACIGGIPVWFCAFDPRLPEKNRLLVRKFVPTPEYIQEIEAHAVRFLGEIEAMFEQLSLGVE